MIRQLDESTATTYDTRAAAEMFAGRRPVLELRTAWARRAL
jgi:hypothetical protein